MSTPPARGFLLSAGTLIMCLSMAAISNTISPYSIGAGYGQGSGSEMRLFSMIGEPIVGRSSGTGVEIISGFLPTIHGAVVNQKPRLVSSRDTIARVDSIFVYRARGFDREDGTNVMVNFLKIPSWMSATPPFLSGTPSRNNGDTSFLVVITDMGGLSDTTSVKITLLTANTPVKITSPTSVTVYEHGQFSYRARVLDPMTLQTVSYSNFPGWMQVVGDSIRGVPPEGAKDTSFKVIATGVASSDIITVQVTVIPVNDPPMITSDAIWGMVTNVRSSYKATAVDPEKQPVTISFSGVPSWLSTSGDSVYGTPAMAAKDTFLTVIASDGVLQSTKRVDVRVQQVNTPPRITSPLSASATQHRYFVYRITAEDAESGPELLSITLGSTLPSWLSHQGDSVFGTPRLKGIGTVSIVIRVTDGFNPVQQTVSVAVKDSNFTPVISAIANQTIQSLTEFEHVIVATDLDAEHVGKLRYGLTSGPAGMTVDSVSGRLRWYPSDADTGTRQIVVHARDPEGATGTATFSLRVRRNSRPRCTLKQITAYQRDTVRVPFSLDDPDAEPITLRLFYRFSLADSWTESIRLRGNTDIGAAQYENGSIFWVTNQDDAFKNQLREKVWIRLVPYDSVGLATMKEGFADSTPAAHWFTVDNTPSLIVEPPTPAPNSRLVASASPVFTVKVRQGEFDPSTVSDLNTVSLKHENGSPVPILVKCTATELTVVPNSPLMAGSRFILTLKGTIKDKYRKFLDGNGDGKITELGTEDVSWGFSTGYLSDFTGNDTVDIRDFIKAAGFWTRSARNNWQPTDSIVEAGPVVGTAPHYRLTPDSVFDSRDLAAFMRMWYWMDGQIQATPGGSLAKRMVESEALPDLTSEGQVARIGGYRQSPPAVSSVAPRYQRHQIRTDKIGTSPSARLDLFVEAVPGLAGARYRIWGGVRLNKIATERSILESGGDALALTRNGNGWTEANIVRFSSNNSSVAGSGEVASLLLDRQLVVGEPKLLLDYELYNESGDAVEKGVIELGNFPGTDEPSGMDNPVAAVTLISLPNPLNVSSRRVAFELVDRPEAVSWVQGDQAGAVLKFSLQAVPEDARLRCAIVIRNFHRGIVAYTPERDLLGEVIAGGGRKTYRIYWNGRAADGSACPTGVYEAALYWESNGKKGVQRFKIGVR